MPPRLQLFTAVRRSSGCVHGDLPLRPFSTTPAQNASTVQQKKRKHADPYAAAQARARRAANISRQATLKQERARALGDPVRGVTTPFLQSFDTAFPSSPPSVRGNPSKTDSPIPDHEYLNHFVTQEELSSALEKSGTLTAPVASEADLRNPRVEKEQREAYERDHENAKTAIERIVSVQNSSAKDRLRVNVKRCIDMFGRHKTDELLKPKIGSGIPKEREVDDSGAETGGTAAVETTPRKERAGADTGSSEVQIAILTAKIRSLANYMDKWGNKDKVNKRNLRLLVHKRQKLLQYLRRKERGGERWQHVIEKLGLTDATWKGEISL